MAIEINTLARPYAKAAFEYALENKTLQEWSGFLQAAATVSSDARVIALLKDPSISSGQCAEIYTDILSSLLDDSRKNFLAILSLHRRLSVLPQIALRFKDYRAEHEKTIDVTAITFRTISDSQKSAIAQKLEKRLGRKVNIKTEIDPTLIGGLIIRAGDLVIDGSLKGRLNKLREQLTA